MKILFRGLIVLLPWIIRRHVLRWFYGYELDPTSHIGFSWIYPASLKMGAHAKIGHFNIAIHLDRIEMGPSATIDRCNWITGFPRKDLRHFGHVTHREPWLIVGEHASITKHHHFDCTAKIVVGAFTTIAGYRSQFLTHSIDIVGNQQDCGPIQIGEYCFVGTSVVALAGCSLPPRSVAGACALLNKAYVAPGWLYAGVPARPVCRLPAQSAYFNRSRGFVD
ncbi:MAG TPA: hypothetical protein VHE81_12600 [Lacipirellulaceae bacterium]|nr:hypothetical protein [Lacipirellulaceae bacterium]